MINIDPDSNSSGLIRVIHVVNAQKEEAINNYLKKFKHKDEDFYKLIKQFKSHYTAQLDRLNNAGSQSLKNEDNCKTINKSTCKNINNDDDIINQNQNENSKPIKNVATAFETSIKPVITPINRLVYNDQPQPDQNCVFIDFGGKNFRVGCCCFSNKSLQPALHTELQIFPVPKRLLSESLEKIVEFIAAKLVTFCRSKVYKDNVSLSANKVLRIACVFSFPFDHIDGDRTRVVIRRFTKQIEFTSDDREFGSILEEKLSKYDLGINFKVDCVLNDTTATLLSFVNTNIYDSSIVDSTNCLISLIFGTGCNIAYYDNCLNKLICTEIGGYGEKGELDFLKTDIDEMIINENSCHVGEQAFEKFGVSDPYLGEAVRLIIVDMIRKEYLFVESSLDRDLQEDPETSFIEEQRSLAGSEFVTKILKNSNNIVQVQDTLAKYNLFSTFSDCKNIIEICDTISKRAAKLVAAMLCSIILRINEKSDRIVTNINGNGKDKLTSDQDDHLSMKPTSKNLVVACDGNLWRKHPNLKDDVCEYLHDFLRHFGDDTDVRFNISTMSSGPGAAACCFGKLWE